MQYKKQGSVEWLEFDILANFPSLKHASFLRHGGLSEGNFASLNFSDFEDDVKCVKKNLTLAMSILSIKHLQQADQSHSDNIIQVQKFSKGYPKCDALMTSEKGLGLMIKHADCQATILYDPINHAVAAIHVGWRGLVNNIYQKTIERMKKNLDLIQLIFF